MMHIKSTESLSNKKLDELFIFLLDKSNFKNKMDVNTLFWDLIYLRKLLNKSIRSRKSSKKNLIYNYIMLDSDDKIIGCISYKYLLEVETLALWDLTIIIKPEHYDDSVNTTLIKNFREHDNFRSEYEPAVLAVYMPVENHKINSFFTSESSSIRGYTFAFGLEDSITYSEKYNIYYNFQPLQNTNHDTKSNTSTIHTIPKSIITTGNIISLLLNSYNLDSIIQQRTGTLQLSRITKKRISAPEIKIITKDIYDIHEIQNLPDYDYDFFKIYSMKFLFIFEYLININMSVHNFVMKRFFPGSLLYNENLYKIYTKIVNTAVENIKIEDVKDKILNINFIIKNNNYFVYEIEHALVYNLVGKYNNRLIITNNLSKIKYFSIYKNDIISIKQFCNPKERNNELYDISDKIMSAHDYNTLSNILGNKLGKTKKYDCILTEIMYANFDYIENINLICKTQTIIFIVLNALLKLNKRGCLVINLRGGYLDTPIFKKILTFLCGLFNSNEFIGLYSINRIFITFDNFKGLDSYNLKIIEYLIEQSKAYENNEITQNDMIGLLLSNKFNYQINDFNIDIKIRSTKFNSKVLFDIEGLYINNKLISNIMDKYNLYLKKHKIINNQISNFYKITNLTNADKIKIIKYQYIYLFEDIKKYNIIDIENINYLIKIFKL